jgi:uroporphyrinogen decarboxylase
MNMLQGHPVDRTPVFAVLSAYGGRVANIDLRTLYNDVESYVTSQQMVQKTFGFDLVLPPFDYCAIAEAFGGEIVYFEDQPPNMKRPATIIPEKVLKIPLPSPWKTERLPMILEATRRLHDLFHGKVTLLAPVPGCCILPSLIMGLDAWMETLVFDAPLASDILQYTSQFFVAWANALIDAGVDGLIVPEGMATVEIATRELFLEQLLPHLRATLEMVQGPVIFHHTGGHIGHVLDLLPGLPNLVAVVIGPRDSLTEARRLLGPDVTLLGNLDNVRFHTMTPEEVHRQCMACLETAVPAGRYILSHSGPDIPFDTPPENLHAMIAASREYAETSKALV